MPSQKNLKNLKIFAKTLDKTKTGVYNEK